MNSNSRQAVLDMLLLCYENNTETKLKIKNNFILIKKKKKKKRQNQIIPSCSTSPKANTHN